MPRIALNVSGTCFEFDSTILKNGTGQRLAELCNNAKSDGQGKMFCVDRPAKAFAAILTFYQTGQLHIPLDMCPGSFQQEMEFWQVDHSELTECCSYRLVSLSLSLSLCLCLSFCYIFVLFLFS